MNRFALLGATAIMAAVASPTIAMADSNATKAPAPIVFFDIAGPDAAKLRDFYSGVFGWSIDAKSAIKTPGLDGTLRQDPAEKVLYVGVPDIDAALKDIVAHGGSINTPRMVVPGVVTFALFMDPAGNRMGLIEIKPK